MKKKWIAALLCVCMVLGINACAAPDEENAPQGEPLPSAVTETHTPVPLNMTPDARNHFPYMGIDLALPEKLLSAVRNDTVFMRSGEKLEYTDLGDSVPMDWMPSPEHTLLHGGYFEFFFLPKEIRSGMPHRKMETPMTYEQFETWLAGAIPLAKLQMDRTDEFQQSELESNGYARHIKLGEYGGYVYHLSLNDVPENADSETADIFSTLEALKQGISLCEPRPIDERFFSAIAPEVEMASKLNPFNAQTLDGDPADNSLLSGKKLTMVNLWTTWCSACVAEMPDLEALNQSLKDSDVQIISICCDTSDARGRIDEELLALARQIAQRTGTTFPTLVPDASLQDGFLKGLTGYPTTFFLDSEGNIIGEPVLGSYDQDGWMQIIEERLLEVQ